jgi:hypothetical protein
MERLQRLVRGTFCDHAGPHSPVLRAVTVGFFTCTQLGALLEVAGYAPVAMAGGKAGLAVRLLGQAIA